MSTGGELQPRPERLQSATRALAVLDVLAGHPDGATPKAIAAELGLHLSTTYHLLNTLVAAGYAARCAECRLFRLGPRIPHLHDAFVASVRPSPTAMGLVRALHEATGETAQLCRLLGDDCVSAAVIEGTQPTHITGTRVGMSMVAHAVASGRILLAWQPEPSIDAYLGRADLFDRVPLRRLNTPRAIRTELGLVRKAGYALDPGDGHAEFCCIAAPLPAGDGQVSESLALLVPRRRFEWDQAALVATVVAIAKVAAQMLGNESNATDGRSVDAVAPDLTTTLRAAVVARHRAYLNTAYPRLV